MDHPTAHIIDCSFWELANIKKFNPPLFRFVLEDIEMATLETDIMLDIRFDLRTLC